MEYASCSLSEMAFLFDFEDAHMVELTWPNGDCELSEIIERTKHLLSLEVEQKFGMGMPYFVHTIMPQEPTSAQSVVDWFTHNEPIAIEHFVATKPAGNDIVLRIVYIRNEIGNKIADEAFKNNRIINNYKDL